MLELSALIIDDERRGRELLEQLLSIHCPEITSVKTAGSLDEALTTMRSFQPHVLFLDIRLGNELGLDIIPFLLKPAPHIIITTAHQEFAIKAIKANVLDYLLKPIIGDELKAAVKKATDMLVQQEEVLPKLLHSSAITINKKISVPTLEGFTFVNVSDILYCKAEGAYTCIYLKDGICVLVSSNLGELEKLLPERLGFFRAHHTWLINIQAAEKFIKREGGHVVMSNQKEIPVSQRKKAQFLEFIKQLS